MKRRIGGKRIFDNVNQLSAFVRAGRSLLNMTQSDLANLVGISRLTIARLERSVQPLSYGVLISIVHKFRQHGISSEDIDEFLIGTKSSLDKIDIVVDWDKATSKPKDAA